MRKRIIVIIAVASVIVAAVGIGIVAFMLRGGTVAAMNVTDLSVGEKYLAELKYTQATATLQRVITVEPNNTEAYIALAKAYQYTGDLDAARETLQSGYDATGSVVIARTLSEMTDDWANTTDLSATETVATVEIAGRFYAADITELVLRDCGLRDADLQSLSLFTHLERLDISGNGLTDISALSGVPTLKKLFAAHNAITDITALADLPNIAYIGLRGNQITNADALFGIGSIQYLHLSDNQITQVSGISDGLQLLYLANNKISDTASVTGAGLLYVDISGNPGR